MNKFRAMPIVESGEPLVEIPKGLFVLANPHPYVKEKAPYEGASPWMLRAGVLDALEKVQNDLQKHRPGWKIMLTDAYRPNSVQIFKVEQEFKKQARLAGFRYSRLTPSQRKELEEPVHRLWARPSEDPATPPPHSTGGVLDCTFANKNGWEIFMGSPVDENSERSNPDYFAATRPAIHARREMLNDLMSGQGFRRANDEWWHFSKGDQFWAFYEKEKGVQNATAIYGRADLLKLHS